MQIEIIVSHSLQNLLQMALMLVYSLGIDQDVIHEDDDELVDEIIEQSIANAHCHCRCIRQPKRYHRPLIITIFSSYSGLLDIAGLDGDLMIVLRQINLAENLRPGQLLNDLVNWG